MKRRATQMGVTIISLGLVVGWGAPAGAADRTLTALPFDPDISVYIGFAGQWQNLETGVVQEMEVRAKVAAFQAGETPTEEGVDDGAFILPNLPPGWEMEGVDPVDEQITMVVIIEDQQNRLGRVAISNLNQGDEEGELTADATGRRIEGTLAVSTMALYHVLEVYSSQGHKLFGLGLRRAGVVNYYLQPVGAGFDPNGLPRDVTLPVCPGYDRPPGDPRDLTGKTSHLEAAGQFTGCMTRRYANPEPISPDPGEAPPAVFFKREVLRNQVDPQIESLARNPEVLTAARQQDLTVVTTPIKPPPYSQGGLHWDVNLRGEVTGILAVPLHRAKPKWYEYLLASVRSILDPTKDAEKALEAAMNWKLGQDELARKETGLRPGDVQAAGSIWALGAALAGGKIDPLGGYQQEVTFVILGDITPNGPNQPISGSVTVESAAPWTNPPPGGEATGIGSHPAETGTVTVPLTKGYTYTVKASPTGTAYRAPADALEVRVPQDPNNPIHFTCNLAVLLELRVKTQGQDGTGVAATVTLQEKREGGYVDCREGTSQLIPNSNPAEYVATFPNLDPTKIYKLVATSAMGRGETNDFTVSIGVSQTKTVTITGQGGGIPPGGGGGGGGTPPGGGGG